MTQQLIYIKGENKTSEIKSCKKSSNNQYEVIYNNSEKVYPFNSKNIEILNYTYTISPKDARIINKLTMKVYYNVEDIMVYKSKKSLKYVIKFKNKDSRILSEEDIIIDESSLKDTDSENIFNYLKSLAELSELRNENLEPLILNSYNKIDYLSKEAILSNYINPKKNKIKRKNCRELIFPFGCNASQYQATKYAMENQISIIQGPPGTGKTQTILNILSNILMEDKTAIVVSNNNAAIENIYDKLSDENYELDFLLAYLGNTKNKELFIKNQNINYPDFIGDEKDSTFQDVKSLESLFELKEREAELNQEISNLLVEKRYFNEFLQQNSIPDFNLDKLSSKKSLELWADYESTYNDNSKLNLLFKIKSLFKYRIFDWNFYKDDLSESTINFQNQFYIRKERELKDELETCKQNFYSANGSLKLEKLQKDSLQILKNKLSKKYKSRKRICFDKEDLIKKSNEFINEYPIVLSTTFSSRQCLNKDFIYDYLIVDEASQVDIVTGALAMSCAKNIVVVGDIKQLPVIVSRENKKKSEKILKSYKLSQMYSYTKSFLESVLEVFPDAEHTLLKEHYRCHPKIIQFCNKKFYDDKLVIMTTDNDEENVVRATKTVLGNHSREHYNQREIDSIKLEVINRFDLLADDTAIIAPYRNQVNELKIQLDDYDSDTVHKFQGREKDNIIITTVDNKITKFTDDPNLLNVAISRAKKNIFLVTTGNEQPQSRNISDLLGYIEYQNFEITESKIYSVFDYLYKQYEEARINYLKGRKNISRFDSENLMYALIEEVLDNEDFNSLESIPHYKLKEIFKDNSLLNEPELKYASHGNTHVDFMIVNKITKDFVLAIEVDGYKFHKKNSKQREKDIMKDKIFEKYKLPLIRFKTNGSNEKERLIEKLKYIL